MVDFRRIAAESTLYTFHAHTQFCDGRDTMEAIVAAAVAHGFTHIGFSPHSPIPFASPCNMSKASVPLYLDEICRLRAKFAGQIEIFQSMEIDFTEVSGPADDKPGIDQEPWYDKLVHELYEAIADHHLTVEVNTKSWEPYGRFFPASRYFGMLKHSGLTVVFNSDAHFAGKVNDGRVEAMRQYAIAK